MIIEGEARDMVPINVDLYTEEAKNTFENTFGVGINHDRIAAAIFMAGYVLACAKDFETSVQAGVVKMDS